MPLATEAVMFVLRLPSMLLDRWAARWDAWAARDLVPEHLKFE